MELLNQSQNTPPTALTTQRINTLTARWMHNPALLKAELWAALEQHLQQHGIEHDVEASPFNASVSAATDATGEATETAEQVDTTIWDMLWHGVSIRRWAALAYCLLLLAFGVIAGAMSYAPITATAPTFRQYQETKHGN